MSMFQFLSFPGKIHLINTDQELQSVASRLESVKALVFEASNFCSNIETFLIRRNFVIKSFSDSYYSV